LLHGLATGTNWVFRDESAHMQFAFSVVQTIREEEPELFDEAMIADVQQMLREAVGCETQFATDLLGQGLVGLSVREVRGYLEYIADQRLAQLGLPQIYGTKNPLSFMELQDVQELTNFFERRVASYQVGVSGEVVLDGGF
jgi:ribonucleoside-diphosphate reductase beta chain